MQKFGHQLQISPHFSSRFTHAAAREGHLPTFLSCINAESNSPRAALLFQLICTIAVTFVDTER